MANISDKVIDPNFWGAFKIPAFAFAVTALLLVLRNVNLDIEYTYIQHTAGYAIGASIISYWHSLTHSTWLNHNRGADLPFYLQNTFIALHAGWFGLVIIHCINGGNLLCT